MSYLSESNATGETTFSFEGYCAMANAVDANEVQGNVVAERKGKSEIEGVEAITNEIAQRNRQRMPVNTRKAASWADGIRLG